MQGSSQFPAPLRSNLYQTGVAVHVQALQEEVALSCVCGVNTLLNPASCQGAMPSVQHDSRSMIPSCGCRPASQSRARRLEVPKHTTHALNQLPSRYGSPQGFQRKLTRADLLIAIPAEVSRCASHRLSGLGGTPPYGLP